VSECSKSQTPKRVKGLFDEGDRIEGRGRRVWKELTKSLPLLVAEVKFIFEVRGVEQIDSCLVEEGELAEGKGVVVKACMGSISVREREAAISRDLVAEGSMGEDTKCPLVIKCTSKRQSG
jgi:hypothetical protein